MKILHLCTYDAGGAANAAIRLHEGLLDLGEESVFASKTVSGGGRSRRGVLKGGGDWIARRSPSIEFHLARLLHPTVSPVITRGYLPGCGLRAMDEEKPDILHLHWVDHGLLGHRDLARLSQRRIPLVWTLHDMAPLAGGFGYREGVGLPPAAFGPLACTDRRAAASQHILRKRADALRDARLTVVAPSRWLAEEARRSPVFSHHRVEHIPYGIDTHVFGPLDRGAARDRWNIPRETRVILFGADTFEDHRKGIDLLKQALTALQPRPDLPPLLLVGFGNRAPISPGDFPIPAMGVGRLSDAAEIASLYNAADVFVCPSREDNLPNTMVESLACGTPVVGFHVGGIPDLVIPGETGYLAHCFEPRSLAESLILTIDAPNTIREAMRTACRVLAVSKLTLAAQASAYLGIYRQFI